jgi:replicative DNA helicase
MDEKQLKLEISVIGAFLNNHKLSVDDVEGLSADDFWYAENKSVWSFICKTLEDGRHADALLIYNTLSIPLSEVVNWAMVAPLSKATVKSHAKAIKTAATLRNIKAVSVAIGELSKTDDGLSVEEKLDKCQNILLNLSSHAVDREARHIKDVMVDAIEVMMEKMKTGDDRISGLSTGIEPVDRATQGMQPGDLIIVAGRSSMGKTSFAIQMGTANERDGIPVLINSLEMSEEQIGLRILSNIACVPLMNLVHGKPMYELEYDRMNLGLGKLYQSKIHIDDQSSVTVQQIRAKAKQHKARHGLRLLVIDQLSHIKHNKERRTEGYGDITKALKSLAKELQIPIVLLHQLNRNTAQEGRRPQLHDLKDSGSVEEDADMVLLIHRPGYYDDRLNQTETEIIIAKNRMGPRETIQCGWLGEYAKFIDAPIPDDRPMSGSETKPARKKLS